MVILGLTIGDFAFGTATSFLLGVLVANLNAPWLFVGPVFMAASLAAAFLFSFGKVWRPAAAILLVALCGIFYFHAYENWAASQTRLIFNAQISFSGVVVQEPVPSQKFTLLTVDVRPPLAGQVTILAPPQGDFQYGDVLSVTGMIFPPSSVVDSPFLYLPEIVVTGDHGGFWLREKLIDFKIATLGEFQALLSQDEAGLLGAMVFSDTRDIGITLKNELTQSGTIYLVTMYGVKLGLIAFFITNLLVGKVSRKIIAGIVSVIIMLFIMMTNAPVSALRAGVMAGFALIARETGWRVDVKNALAFAAVGITLFDPTAMVTDVGFVLSFASVVGIIYLAPAIKRFLRLIGSGMLGWKESFCMAMAAQLAVMPIITVTFGSFPVTGIFAGMLIMIALPLTMLAGWMLAFSGFSGVIAFFAAMAARPFIAYDLGMVRFFANVAIPISLPFSLWFVTALYYSALAWFAWRFRSRVSVIPANAGLSD